MKALIIDNGGYVDFAERLAREIEVAYFSNWNNAFPLSKQLSPGIGIEGIERINEPIRYMLEKKPDLVCVPGLNNQDMEFLARSMKIPTFGAGDGNRLENDRWFLKEFLEQHHLSLMESLEITGLDDLREYLEDPKHEDKWIKASAIRGDMQTFHHKKWSSTSVWLTELTRRLGPIGRNLRFVIEEPIPDAIEVSIEGIFVHDVLLTPFMVGYEIKDAGEVGFLCDSIDKLPRSIQQIVNDVSDFYGETKYRNFFALELRMTPDGTAYLIDATCRIPNPPGSVLMAAIDDFASTIWQAANGIADGSFGNTKYLAEIELKSPWIATDFLQVHYPPEIADNLGLSTYCQIDGETWSLPHVPEDPENTDFGSVFGFGPELEPAAKKCQEVAEQVEAYQMTYDANVLEKAKEEIAKGEKMGIKP